MAKGLIKHGITDTKNPALGGLLLFVLKEGIGRY